jgi:repressor of nif and glnA expression
MPANYDALQAAVAAAVAEATRTTTTEDGAGALIAALGSATLKAVQDALAADNTVDQATVDAVTKAVTDTTAAFAAGDDKLGAAIVAGTPVVPSQTPAAR